jgi:hypothetical protein
MMRTQLHIAIVLITEVLIDEVYVHDCQHQEHQMLPHNRHSPLMLVTITKFNGTHQSMKKWLEMRMFMTQHDEARCDELYLCHR